jgi:hypothetical protein
MQTRTGIWLAGLIVAVTPAPNAAGHGTPIHVEAAGNRLVVSEGLIDGDGFAPMIFLEDDEDGAPFGSVVLPQIGPIIVWQLPGFEIVGLDDESSLSIEILMRPDNHSNPFDERLLWYWDPETELAGPAPAALHLLGTGMRSTTLTPTAGHAPEPFLLADPIAGKQGFHNHGLLSYALDNDPPPPAGAYGFFARLLSDSYAGSDPFLLVFNHDVEPAQMPTAGLAINFAAFLPGDYNHDDRVDAADYLAWRKTFGSTTELAADGSGNMVIDTDDYNVWRANFGRLFGGSGVTGAIRAVPEPSGLAVVIAGMAVTWAARRKRGTTACRNRMAGLRYRSTTRSSDFIANLGSIRQDRLHDDSFPNSLVLLRPCAGFRRSARRRDFDRPR